MQLCPTSPVAVATLILKQFWIPPVAPLSVRCVLSMVPKIPPPEDPCLQQLLLPLLKLIVSVSLVSPSFICHIIKVTYFLTLST